MIKSIAISFSILFVLFIVSLIGYSSFFGENTSIDKGRFYSRNVVVPKRGSLILDRMLIAWSKQRLGLFIKVPQDFDLLNNLLSEVKKFCYLDLGKARKKCLDKSGQEICLKEQLSLGEVKQLEEEFENDDYIFIKLYEKRYYNQEYKSLAGNVEYDEKGFLVGKSGLEKLYDQRLVAKQQWIYSVYKDKNKKWITGTYKTIQTAIKGENVALSSENLDKILLNE